MMAPDSRLPSLGTASMPLPDVAPAGRARSVGPVSCLLVTLALTAGCSVDTPTSTRVPSGPSFAKAPAGLTVTSTNPSYAHRGDTKVSVHVFGSGFAAGANAQWTLGVDTTSVTTGSTTLVSSTELVAVITVSGTAPLALYNVSVTNRDGKKGVGAELFAVTAATIVGPGTIGGDVIVNEISDQGNMVGYFDAAGPFVTNGNTIISLGSTGQAWGVSPTGDVVVGRDNAPVAWVRQSSGSYVKETLPALVSVGGGAMHAGAGPNGTLMVGGYQRTSAAKTSQSTQPVVWTRSAGIWSTPTVYTRGGDQGTGWGVTGSGRMMGRNSLTDGSTPWGVWDSPTTFVQLTAPYLQTMNQAATVVVGVLPAGGPGLWYRDVSTGRWNPTAVALPIGPAGCGTGGSAQDINDDGIIVGYSCGNAAVWRIDASVSPPAVVWGPAFLLGLDGSPGARADAITNTYPYVVAGRATSNGRGLLVKWTIQ
jgi:hypothetical protein